MKIVLLLITLIFFNKVYCQLPIREANSSSNEGTLQSNLIDRNINGVNDEIIQGFVINQGQVPEDDRLKDDKVLFYMISEGAYVYFGSKSFTLYFPQNKSEKECQLNPRGIIKSNIRNDYDSIIWHKVSYILENTTSNTEWIPQNNTGYHENFYLDHCPNGIIGVPAYNKFTLKNVYPGIDWVFKRDGSFFKHEFHIAEGGDYKDIAIHIESDQTPVLDETGNLSIDSPEFIFQESAPLSYTKEGYKILKTSAKLNSNTLRYSLDTEPNESFVIDPSVEWGTYYGGGLRDYASDVETDENSNVYLCGSSEGGPLSYNGHQNSAGLGYDAYLVKFDPNGNRIWATWYGGSGTDYGGGIALDNSNNVYMSGTTQSDGVIASGGHQNSRGGVNDAFLVKFNSAGIRQWGTYYGSITNDEGHNVSTDLFGNVILYGQTTNSSGIASGGHQNIYAGGLHDCFLVKFNAAGTRQWATYYGGSSSDEPNGITTDASGNIFICGWTNSTNNMVTTGAHDVTFAGPNWDAFLVKFNAAGVRQWGTYYGNTGEDFGEDCAVDDNGDIYLAGYTGSTSGIAAGGFDNSFGFGTWDAFLVKFSSNGIRIWGTYFGSSGEDFGFGCDVATSGDIILTGATSSTFGISFDGYQNNFGGGTYDSYLVKFDSFGNRKWATYYGGSAGAGGPSERGVACAFDLSENAYMAGYTPSTNNIAYNGYQMTNGGGAWDAFLVKFNECTPTTSSIFVTECDSYSWPANGNTYNSTGAYTATLTNATGCDSVVTLNLTINNSNTGSETVTECDSYIWPADGNTYNSTGAYTATLTNAAGCDSVVTLNLTINNSNTGSETITSCDSYTWPADGSTYNSTGVYSTTLINAAGCDSVVTLNLTINNSNTGSETVTECDSYIWPADGNTYNSTGAYTATLTNAAGCDSVVTLNLTINNSNTDSETITSCDSYTWPANGNTYNSTGAYTATLTNAAGCDSVVTLNLTINNSNTGSETITSCDSYTWPADGSTYNSTGAYTATLTNAAGCDSVVTLNLTITNSNTGSESVTECDNYTWPTDGNTYNSTGTYTATLTNAVGCDSIVTLDLTIINSNTGSETVTECDSYTWPADGNTYTSTGTYSTTLTNAASCDSVVTLNLTINTVSDVTTAVSGITITANNTNASYIWLDCNNSYAIIPGETNQSYTPSANGNYAVELAENGCTDTSACVAITTVGIIENTFNEEFTLYPNPTDGLFSIQFNSSQENITLRIMDASGKLIDTKNYDQADLIKYELNQPKGIYLIEVYDGENQRSLLRIIKQ